MQVCVNYVVLTMVTPGCKSCDLTRDMMNNTGHGQVMST